MNGMFRDKVEHEHPRLLWRLRQTCSAMVDDAYSRYVVDVGINGADKGQGGNTSSFQKSGYFVTKSPTHGHLIFYRALSKMAISPLR